MALSSPRFANNERLRKAAQNNPAMGFGEIGEPVRIIQQSLIELGYWMDISIKKFNSPDGIFGNETRDRVTSFQRGHGLYPDGIVGRFTMEKLDSLLPTAGPILPPLPKKADFKHRFRVHLRSLSLTELPMSYQEQNARMVFAQYGISMDVMSGMSMMLSSSQLTLLDTVDTGTCTMHKVEGELAELHKVGLQGVAAKDLVVYFAKKVVKANGKELNGCASSSADRPAVVVSASSSPWTMGHEIGHVLLGGFRPTHSTDTSNLMFSPSSNITSNPPGFSPEQLTAIRGSQFVSPY